MAFCYSALMKLFRPEVQSQTNFRSRNVAVRVVKSIHSKLVCWSVAGAVPSVTHPMANVQRGEAIAVVIIHQNGLDTVLFTIHKRVLLCFRICSLQNHWIPSVWTVDDFASRSGHVIMKCQPRRMRDGIVRVEPPQVLVSFRVDSKHFG